LQNDFLSYRRPHILHRTSAFKIMDPITKHQKLKVDSTIRKVIELFKETKFAFIPNDECQKQ
jgi:hypothetical protein